MINQGMGQRRDFHNVVLHSLSSKRLVFFFCVCVCEHLGEGEGGEAGLSSVDSSDLPTSSGLLLGERCPDGGRHNIFESWR